MSITRSIYISDDIKKKLDTVMLEMQVANPERQIPTYTELYGIAIRDWLRRRKGPRCEK